jgi:homoserine dehydrogenase
MTKNINIAIVGFGNVGSYLYKIIQKNKRTIFKKTGKIPIVKYISAKNLRKKRSVNLPKSKWIKNPILLTKKKDVDIIFELVGGAEGIAKKLVFAALKNKKHVITANKSLMAKHGDELAFIAENNKVNLEYEASVAGGVPVIKSIKEGLISNKINKIYGILNGTTNYILSTMSETGKNFIQVLNDAKKLGFSESNPKSDLNGSDAAAKIRILSSIAFNTYISKNKILTEGIQNLNQIDIFHAKNLGYKIKLLSISEIIKNRLIERVHPCLVVDNSYIGNINGVLNAVIIDGFPIGKSVFQGEGAGPGATSSSLISDLCSILRGNIKYPFGVSCYSRKKIKPFDILKHTCSSYLRIDVKDKPGVLSSITKIFSRNKISIKNLIQVPNKIKKNASIVIITHSSSEKNFQKLLFNLKKNKFINKYPTFIRIEKI